MAYNECVFELQYQHVLRFVQHFANYIGIFSTYEHIANHRDFWRSTCDSHIEVATIAWCKVFGSYNETTHWTKTTNDEQARNAFRCLLSSRTCLDQAQWTAYHKTMLEFRDKYVAHFDVNKHFESPVPQFANALEVAYVYQEWVRDLIKSVLLGQPTLRSLYEQYECEAREAASRFTGLS